MSRMKKRFDSRYVLMLFIVALILSSPFIYRAWCIKEVYLYPDVRERVLDSVFFVREMFGATIGDLTIKDVIQEEDVLHVVIHEEYHGLVDHSAYDDLEMDYYIDYDYGTGSFDVRKVENAG